MIRWMMMCLVLAGAQPAATPQGAATKAEGPQYTADGQMRFPTDYREWIFLSSGMDMSYQPNASPAAHSVFDNVFVNPAAYRSFLKTGTWPEGTMMMLEVRGGEGNHSINARGRTQSTELMGLEIHVKDSAHVKGGWGFYRFEDKVSGKLIERLATCYTCHEAHGAVDTTFVQFYPTLLPLAKEKGTLSAEYLKDEAAGSTTTAPATAASPTAK